MAGWVAGAGGATQAQGLQVDGQIGYGLNHRNHQVGGGRLTDLNTAAVAVSYLGLYGREDLGVGQSVVYRLESSLNPATGEAGKTFAGSHRYFDRQAYLGWEHQAGASLTLGRQFHAATERIVYSFDVLLRAGANVHLSPTALYGLNSYQGYDGRVDNAVKWRLGHLLRGTTLAASYGMGLQDGARSRGASHSWELSHVQPQAYTVGLAYVRYNATVPTPGTDRWPNNSFWTWGLNWNWGAVRPYVAYYHSRLTPSVTGVDWVNRIWGLGLRWQSSDRFIWRSAYYLDKGSGLNHVSGRDGRKVTLVLLGEYLLSSHTSLYGLAARNTLAGGYLTEPVASSALGRDSSARALLFYSIGINHRF
ncbi:porin [Curvibacter sp. HBC28]|uniref:Porin n=1 Tax=Curvibacter microcysteis TaxID=3026419 RepID=A0ABT5MKF2_9BURK|nr:porin [Curvibacter sp. HBC28]MDD0817044.1 porin [Curvibacter sp. HBC28]